jgi:two-component system phosphate regulon response regulator PhoB
MAGKGSRKAMAETIIGRSSESAKENESSMAKCKILVVEDDEDIRELVRFNLVREGHRVFAVSTGEEALDLARKERPDLIVLDLMLPGMDGLEVCKILRGEPATSEIPIVIVSAKGEESDVVTGLELGADDYLTKPFRPRILLARIKAVLRRNQGGDADENATITIDELTIDPGRHEVRVKEKPVQLTATEFRILHFLARRPGWVFTRYQIVDGVHGADYPVTDRSIDFQMVGLRKKLGPCAKFIETVRGVGYRFKD